MKGNIAHGASYLPRGAKLLKHPSLRLFVLIPLVVNILIFGGLIWYSLSYLDALMEGWLGKIPDWLDFISWIIWPIVGLTVSLITGYLFTAVALLIASPFNALLAEKAEELVTGKPVNSLEGLGAALMALPRGVWRELSKLLYYVPMAVFVLILSFIPVLGIITPVLWFLLGAWMMSIQFVDYPMDNHQLS